MALDKTHEIVFDGDLNAFQQYINSVIENVPREVTALQEYKDYRYDEAGNMIIDPGTNQPTTIQERLEHYGKQEIEQAEGYLCEDRNHLFTYAGLDLLLKRYVIQDHSRHALETPQEMYLGIALHLAMKEDRNGRMEWVRRFYDMLSRMQVTMATPTLSNARKPYHQLSSCFIDTVPDSLEGIYRSVDNFAQVSKFGGVWECISEKYGQAEVISADSKVPQAV